jgi:hypothetical protein
MRPHASFLTTALPRLTFPSCVPSWQRARNEAIRPAAVARAIVKLEELRRD